MANGKNVPKSDDYRKLVKQVADRVWQMWQEELKREQTRTGKRQRRK
jgi:hypothetical protein